MMKSNGAVKIGAADLLGGVSPLSAMCSICSNWEDSLWRRLHEYLRESLLREVFRRSGPNVGNQITSPIFLECMAICNRRSLVS